MNAAHLNKESGHLILSFCDGDSVRIGDAVITVRFTTNSRRIQLAFEAPRTTRIIRTNAAVKL